MIYCEWNKKHKTTQEKCLKALKTDTAHMAHNNNNISTQILVHILYYQDHLGLFRYVTLARAKV